MGGDDGTNEGIGNYESIIQDGFESPFNLCSDNQLTNNYSLNT